MSNLVAVRTQGVLEIHFPAENSTYMTYCGLDGNDDLPSVDQQTVKLPKGAKVNCPHCISLFHFSASLSLLDIAEDQRNLSASELGYTLT